MYKAFVVKVGSQYCRFRSYSQFDLVDNPLKASLYSRRRDAEYQASSDHWRGHSLDNKAVFQIYEIEVSIDSERKLDAQ